MKIFLQYETVIFIRGHGGRDILLAGFHTSINQTRNIKRQLNFDETYQLLLPRIACFSNTEVHSGLRRSISQNFYGNLVKFNQALGNSRSLPHQPRHETLSGNECRETAGIIPSFLFRPDRSSEVLKLECHSSRMCHSCKHDRAYYTCSRTRIVAIPSLYSNATLPTFDYVSPRYGRLAK